MQGLCLAWSDAGIHQFRKLVVVLQASQQAAELVVIIVLGQACLSAQHVPSACHQVVQELGALCLACEQGAPDRRQPHLLSTVCYLQRLTLHALS